MLKHIGVLLAVLAVTLSTHAETYLSEQQALNLAFQAGSLQQKRVLISSEQLSRIRERLGIRPSRIFRYWTGTLQESNQPGLAVFGNAIGKLMPFDYMIVTDRDLTIQQIEILAYRESHGGQIRMSAFREQFVGKSPASPPELGNGIRNISGATLSCRSLTTAVSRNLVILEEVLSDAEATVSTLHPRPDIGLADGPKQIGQADTMVSRSRFLMDTILTIRISCDDPQRAYDVMGEVFIEVTRLEMLLSRFRPDSDIGRLNRAAVGDIVDVHHDTTSVLTLSCKYHRQTAGLFDPNYRSEHSLPDSIRILSETEILVVHDLDIDLGALTKGYALDRAAAILRSSDLPRSLLNFGGQILAMAPPVSAGGWPVRFRSATDQSQDRSVLHLANASLATSGNGQRLSGSSGSQWGHIFDPVNRRIVAAPTEIRVTADRAIDADVWSTALFVQAGLLYQSSSREPANEARISAFVDQERIAFQIMK